jgi:hypothetical protein
MPKLPHNILPRSSQILGFDSVLLRAHRVEGKTTFQSCLEYYISMLGESEYNMKGMEL